MRETVITPYKSLKVYFKELRSYKELFFLLAWRDVVLHYKNTAIGVAWVVLRPLLTMTLCTLVVGKWLHVEQSTIAYPLLVLSGIIVWQFFIDFFTYGIQAFISNSQLISKVYFPRIFLPLSRIVCSLLDCCIGIIFYYCLSYFYYGIAPSVKLIFLPIFLGWLGLFSVVITLLFAILITQYRDFKHVVPFIIQIGFYVTPIIISESTLGYYGRKVLMLNPLFGIINGFRWVLCGQFFLIDACIVGIIITLGFIISVITYFNYFENTLIDTL